MSATVTSTDVRQPVTRFGGLIAGAMIAIAVAALIGIAVYTVVVRDNGPAATFDPTSAPSGSTSSASTAPLPPSMRHPPSRPTSPARTTQPWRRALERHSSTRSSAKTSPTKSVARLAAGFRKLRARRPRLLSTGMTSAPLVRLIDIESYQLA